MIDKEQLAVFPAAPGVYIMKDQKGAVIYVGKARNLRQRIRAYFTGTDTRPQIRFLMERAADLGFILTDTEKEALLLENTLIKQHHPRYNVNLRDDKTYFSLRMDQNEEFPRLTIVRKVPRDGARYFGPYSSGLAAREVLKQLYRIFPLRHYPLDTCRRRKRPCLFFQLRQCSAPCHGRITPAEYALLAEGASLFLAGKNRDLVATLQHRMAEAAAHQEYEEAGRIRDLINAIKVTLEKQKVVSHGGDCDVIGMTRNGEECTVVILFIRGGAMTGSRNYTYRWEMDDAEGLTSFLTQYYSNEVFVPDEILLPIPVEETAVIADILTEQRGRQVRVSQPQRGTKVELVRLANRNAEMARAEKIRREESSQAVLTSLQQHLALPAPPRRIECYDISNLQGGDAVGSGVAFLDGRPDKGNYRRYRIRGVTGADDFAMLQEVLSRRFRQGKDDIPAPDLIVVDGGIGQLNILVRCLKELGITGVAAASLAKSRVERRMTSAEIDRSAERVFLPNRKNPLVLRQNSPELLLLARIRDEAHRFAITYHKKLRGKATLRSELDNVPGVGDARRKALLKHFGSLAAIRKATVEELTAVKGITPELADKILSYLLDSEI
jgi:excinuclease ABC subunit C